MGQDGARPGRDHPAGFPGARQLPGRTRRTAPAGPRARRHPGPGKRPRPGLGADPAAGRVRGLRRGTLLLAADYLVPPLPPAECPILRVVHELRACCHAPMTEVKQETTSLDALAEIERQVLWLSTAIVHHANRVRPNPGGLKVGGHQASSASMVSIMTSLWFRHLRAEDRVSVKPHASPVLHAINYRLGGEALRHRIDAMPNPEYQRLLRCDPDELRRRLPGGDESLARLVADLDDAALARAVRNLGGHDLSSLDEA